MMLGRVRAVFSKVRVWHVAVIFTLVGIYLRIKRLNGRDFWGDETFQLSIFQGPFKPLCELPVLNDSTAFPGEYLISYPFVALFGDNKWLINIPHIIATLAAFYLMYLICRRHFKSLLASAIAFFLLTNNRHLIFHSFEFRSYAVLPALSLGAFYFAYDVLFLRETMTTLRKVLIGVFFIFATIYHAYGFMIIGLSFLFWALARPASLSWKDLAAKAWTYVLPWGGACLLLFWMYSSAGNVSWNKSLGQNIVTFAYYPDPTTGLVQARDFLRRVFADLTGHKIKILFYGIWLSFLLPVAQRKTLIGFFAVLILLPIELILMADIKGDYWFLERQFVFVMPLYALFLGWCWDSIYVYAREKFAHRKAS